ncbi:uncharacterized protein LOC117344395 [Pecten maximus]|uniref:uncharacterized protein LOC117344395 n=1 Tax=Pecten maximus TaxID=6579 RepID=UPI001458ABA3|nr:uncharacterized protein LOC117344395 [Pecten maximus]
MASYSFGLAILTLLATFHSGCLTSTKLNLTDGDIFEFQCNVTDIDAFQLFRDPLQYFVKRKSTGETVQISQNSQSDVAGWKTAILKDSSGTFFPFQLSGMVSLNDSGTYWCSRNNFNKSIVLTVNELRQDVGDIRFSITNLDEDKRPTGEEIYISRAADEADPAPKEVMIESGLYQARCTAAGGVPDPKITLHSGGNILAFKSIKRVLLNSGAKDIECKVETGEFSHHLKFNLKINAGHPEILCNAPVTSVGAKDAEFDCLVSGKDLNCAHFFWISEQDMTSFSDKANYTIECEVSEDRRSMKQILKFGDVKESDFEDGQILKFENHLEETFQKVNKLTKEEKSSPQINAGANVVPMGMVSLLFLSVLGLLM